MFWTTNQKETIPLYHIAGPTNVAEIGHINVDGPSFLEDYPIESPGPDDTECHGLRVDRLSTVWLTEKLSFVRLRWDKALRILDAGRQGGSHCGALVMKIRELALDRPLQNQPALAAGLYHSGNAGSRLTHRPEGFSYSSEHGFGPFMGKIREVDVH
jgi:hypothetical protein